MNGINRFDGEEFKFIGSTSYKTYPAPQVIEDAEVDLWIWQHSEDPKLLVLSTLTGEIKSFEQKFGAHSPFKKTDFANAAILANQTIIIGTKTGDLVFIEKDQNVRTLCSL